MTLSRKWIPSPNFSATRQRTQLLVLHTTEGGKTFYDLGRYFGSPSSQVSSHVGIDDQENIVGEFVRRYNKSWTALAANDWGLHAELVGFARWTRSEWLSHPTLLKNVSMWLREEGVRYQIPLVKVSAADIKHGRAGVCGHADVVAAGAGGNHWDPGTNFPWDMVLNISSAPPWPGRYLILKTPYMTGQDIKTFQQQMHNLGFTLDEDGVYGPVTDHICREFQKLHNLVVDGIVGPLTWNEAWK